MPCGENVVSGGAGSYLCSIRRSNIRRMINDFSQFVYESLAVKEGDNWTVYVDGENKRGAINYCEGNNDFEAKEDAWRFYKALAKSVGKPIE